MGRPAPFCNVLHGWSRGQKSEQQNNAPSPKNNAAGGYQGPVKIQLLKGAGLLKLCLLSVLPLIGIAGICTRTIPLATQATF